MAAHSPSRPRPGGKVLAGALALVAAVFTTLLVTVLPARAAVPAITGPDRVFTLPNIPLLFTGVEPFAAPTQKTISITATDNNATCKPQASPQDLTGCSSIKLDVNHGLLKLTPGNAIPTAGDPINGQASLQLSGKVADLNAALATLSFTPDNNYENLPDTPARLVVNATDGMTHDSTQSGSPDNSWTIDIRVANLNGPPWMTDPTGPINVGASSDTPIAGNQFMAADPDANNNGEQGKVLLIKWVTCGTFDVSPSGNYAIGTDIKSLLVNQVGLDQASADLIYAALPDAVKNLMLASSGTNASAFAAVGTLTDINNGLSTVTFHAPATPSTCTMTDLIDDLGNHGLPGQYEKLTHAPGENPTGVELPAMLFAFDTVDFVVAGGAVPQVDVEQGAAQADPTSTSPITFDVTFDQDVTGFGNGDVTLSGTAGATTAVVTPIDGSHYTVAVSGMTQSGTVIASVPASVATAAAAPNNPNDASTSTDHTVTYNQPAGPLTVTIDQAAAQTDPTSTSPIHFTAVFTQPVTGFDGNDILFTGSTVGGTLAATVTGGPSTYDVAVTGMNSNGVVVASIPASAAQDAGTTPNEASTSTDHTVTWIQPAVPPLTVTINQAAAQTDPTSTSPIVFDVVFSAAVTGFDASDVDLSGTAGATTVTTVDSGDHAHFTASATGMTQSGTVIATIAAGVAQDNVPQGNNASTSTDNTVQFDLAAQPEPLTVTINQAGAQADPTSTSPIDFTVVFSAPVTGFTAADVVLSGTAGATAAVVTGSGATYNVAVSGMTQSGTVIATIPADVAEDASLEVNAASTSTDNTVTYDVAPPDTTPTSSTPTSSPPTSSTPTSSTPGNGSSNHNGSTNVQGATAVQPVNGTLPFTGSNTVLLVLLGTVLTIGGLALAVATRRRRQPQHLQPF